MQKLSAFQWYGGKFYHLNWILSHLPMTHHYCEPFGGSAVVLLNRKPSKIETFNDIDGDVVNFFRVLREKPRHLIRALKLTPYSQEEYLLSLEETDDPVERARRFLIRAMQTHTGKGQTATKGRWIYHRSDDGKNVPAWHRKPVKLLPIVERLKNVQLFNTDAFDLIKRLDSEVTLFYCDPPYVASARVDARAYKYEMTNEDHRRLAELLNSVKGLVALSGYDCELMNELYPEGAWRKIAGEEKTAASSHRAIKPMRREVLWLNYDSEGKRLHA